MKGNLTFWALKGCIILLLGCQSGTGSAANVPTGENPYSLIGSIPPPAGYHRVAQPKESFATWLRGIHLKKDTHVRLYNGSLKRNQEAQFAVLDISVGDKDLQQCADAVMRLRSEYLFSQKRYREMDFVSTSGSRFNYDQWAAGRHYRQNGENLVVAQAASLDPASRACFNPWLQLVFTYCGTLSLEKQLLPETYNQMQIGDVFIKGGSPGHAMLVVDMAEDDAGHRIYMLAQSYMPAQDIHIVKNPEETNSDPWYRIEPTRSEVATPEWTFKTSQLRSWPINVNP